MQNVSNFVNQTWVKTPFSFAKMIALFVGAMSSVSWSVNPSGAQTVDTSAFVETNSVLPKLLLFPDFLSEFHAVLYENPGLHFVCLALLLLSALYMAKEAARHIARWLPVAKTSRTDAHRATERHAGGGCDRATGPIFQQDAVRVNRPSVEGGIAAREQAMQSGEHRAMRDFHSSAIRDVPLIDALTGLPNRRAMKTSVEAAMARAQRDGTTFALVIVDLDGFRDVNAIFGDDVGDKVLIRLADVFQSIVQTGTMMGRIGGDEFVFLLEGNLAERQVGNLTKRVLAGLDRDVIVDDLNCRLSASFGVSRFPIDGETHRDLMQAAGVALSHAKSKGRGQVSHYTDEMELRSEDSLKLEYELRRGLEQGELLMFYQPQVDLNTGRYIGAEALLRWQHPQKGLLLPGGFVPMAIDMGLTPAIDRFVLEQVIKQMAEWSLQGFAPPKVSVNMSAATLFTPEFAMKLQALSCIHGVDLSRLEIEVLESSIFPRIRASAEILQELRDLGVTLAIDDFGTGYSSLAMLRDLPLDRIKVDRSFITNIPSDTKDDRIVAGLISMAHSLDIDVIAEGVEDATQADRLIALGCGEAQGYLFGRPMAAHDFVKAWGCGPQIKSAHAEDVAEKSLEDAP